MAHTKDAESQNQPPKIRITVVIANRYAFDTEVATGKQIKDTADVPATSISSSRSALGRVDPIKRRNNT